MLPAPFLVSFWWSQPNHVSHPASATKVFHFIGLILFIFRYTAHASNSVHQGHQERVQQLEHAIEALKDETERLHHELGHERAKYRELTSKHVKVQTRMDQMQTQHMAAERRANEFELLVDVHKHDTMAGQRANQEVLSRNAVLEKQLALAQETVDNMDANAAQTMEELGQALNDETLKGRDLSARLKASERESMGLRAECDRLAQAAPSTYQGKIDSLRQKRYTHLKL